jgi:hypothetical protein
MIRADFEATTESSRAGLIRLFGELFRFSEPVAITPLAFPNILLAFACENGRGRAIKEVQTARGSFDGEEWRLVLES